MENYSYQGKDYQFIRGSDIHRDGMYLELSFYHGNTCHQLAEVFYSDQTGEFTFSAFSDDIPLDLIEMLSQKARLALLPLKNMA